MSTRHIDHEPSCRRFINRATGFLNDGTLVFSPRVFDAEMKENLFRRPVRLVQYGIEIPDLVEIGQEPGGGLENEGLCELRGELRGELRQKFRQDLRQELNIPPDAFVWIAMGRLTRQKGFASLIEAFSQVEADGVGSFLLIVGDGEERRMLEDRAKDVGVAQRVIFLGSRSDTEPLLFISDAFVLSSIWEGGPLVILEAMAAGLPVVSTRVGDASSMVEEGKTGLLVAPGDAGQLADAMNLIQGMGSSMREWGLRGQLRVEKNYDFKRAQREMENYYQEVSR